MVCNTGISTSLRSSYSYLIPWIITVVLCLQVNSHLHVFLYYTNAQIYHGCFMSKSIPMIITICDYFTVILYLQTLNESNASI